MRDNQTTRRMPMIVTAMACATASMLAGLALGPSAMAADTTITLQGADGASLAGHTFNVYQIGTYTGVVLKGNQISSLGIQGTTESNAWADDAITIANGYDKDTSDDITKVGGYDAAGSIAAIDMAKQAKQLSNIQAALNASSRKPATVAGGADLTTQDATLNITVPEEGLYYITDSAGSPIIIGTKSGAGTAMSGAPGRTLGVAVIKSKSVTTDKKVVVDRDGRQVSKQGDAADPVAVTVGDTVTHTIDVTVPNTAVKFKLADAPAGQEYVKGSLKVALSGTATDVTADTVIYDGETQHGAKALPGDATLKKEDRTPADPDITVPAGGWALNATKLITTQGGKKITITYQSVVTKATAEKPSENSVSGTAIFKDGAHYTVVTNGDKVDLKSYDFTLKKVSAADVNTLVDGAEFQIQRGDKYLKLDTTTGEWSEAADQASATTFTTGDSNNDGKVTADATQTYLDLVSADNEHEAGWVLYLQCKRIAVADEVPNTWTETINGQPRESNKVVTKTPDMTPSIHLEKVDTPTLKQEGQEQADRDASKQALKMDADNIGITFIITNLTHLPPTPRPPATPTTGTATAPSRWPPPARPWPALPAALWRCCSRAAPCSCSASATTHRVPAATRP